jgi:formylglycine-generating enzyme required for sulfatase activity
MDNIGVGVHTAAAANSADAIDPDPGLLETFVKEFVLITPGEGRFPATFRMGTAAGPYHEEPARDVTMTGPFSMAAYEVPQNLYETVMGHNPSRWKGPRNSAEMFSVADAEEFCRRTTEACHKQKLIGVDEEIRLPTEAEWEYCCRAGTTTAYSFGEAAVVVTDSGNKASLLDAYSWHTGNAAGNDPPVGAKKPNPWGLYDMHGYLWELCSDDWHDTYSGAPATSVSWRTEKGGAACVIRGGSWKERHECHRSAYRRPWTRTEVSDAVGLRCVLAKVR